MTLLVEIAPGSPQEQDSDSCSRPEGTKGSTQVYKVPCSTRRYIPPKTIYPEGFLLCEPDCHLSSLARTGQASRKPLSGFGAFSKPKKWFDNLPPSVQNKVRNAGFGTFIDVSEKCGSGLGHIEALAERWWDTTNTFHMPFGEMSLTPYDFSMITGIRVGGNTIPFDPKYWTRKDDVTRLLGMYPPQFRSGAVRCSWLLETFQAWPCTNAVEEDQLTRAFLLYLFGCTIFCNLESTVHLSYLPALEHVERIQEYNWGGAAMATLYMNMNAVARMINRSIGGYWYIWEVWFCEYFPTLAAEERPSGHSYPHIQCWIPGTKHKAYDLSLIRQEIDKLSEQDVQWKPWAATVPEAPQYIEEVQDISRKRVILEGLNVRVWFLGERLIRQVMRSRRFRVPMAPPASMRVMDGIDPDELATGLGGLSAQQFFGDLNADYSAFVQEHLMPSLSEAKPIPALPLVTQASSSQKETQATALPLVTQASSSQKKTLAIALPLVTQASSSQQKTRATAITGAIDPSSFVIPGFPSWDVKLPTGDGELVPYAIPRPDHAEGVPLPPHVQEVSRDNMHELFFLTTGLKKLCYKFKTEARDIDIKMAACLNERDLREARLETRIRELEARNRELEAQVQDLKTQSDTSKLEARNREVEAQVQDLKTLGDTRSSLPAQTQRNSTLSLKRCQSGPTKKRKKKKALDAIDVEATTSSEGNYRVEFH